MTFNIAFELNQDDRVTNDLAAKETEINQESDLYSLGKFDGVTGGCDPDPELWQKIPYRQGFIEGIAKYYDQKYQTIIVEDEPF